MEVRESKGSSSRREVRNGFFHLERREKSKKRKLKNIHERMKEDKPE